MILGGKGGGFPSCKLSWLMMKVLYSQAFPGMSGSRPSIAPAGPSPSSSGPQLYSYAIVDTYPHDPNAFTQGLDYDKVNGQDVFWESTGRAKHYRHQQLCADLLRMPRANLHSCQIIMMHSCKLELYTRRGQRIAEGGQGPRCCTAIDHS